MPRRSKEEAERTRERILEAAQRLFAEKGIEKTSLSGIADAAGVTRGAIYWHFKDKAELTSALFGEVMLKFCYMEDLEAAARDGQPDPLGMIRKWLLRHSLNESLNFLSSSMCSVLGNIVFGNPDDRNYGLRQQLREISDRQLCLVRAAMEGAVRAGQLPENLDVQFAAECMRSFIIGYCNCVRMGWAQHLTPRFESLVDGVLAHIGSVAVTRQP
ncbi:MAG: TetR family transcriptional regulator [Succinivibrionaceae bacterium]|nr:TetR family transcriptional regulator [Succinivibrionaceae bacterium]